MKMSKIYLMKSQFGDTASQLHFGPSKSPTKPFRQKSYDILVSALYSEIYFVQKLNNLKFIPKKLNKGFSP